MAKPGPAKGSGGRPRKTTHKVDATGYKRKSVGPPGKGKQVYEHRHVTSAGKGSKEGGTVVHHKDGNKGNNARSNLKVTTRRAHPKHHAK